MIEIELKPSHVLILDDEDGYLLEKCKWSVVTDARRRTSYASGYMVDEDGKYGTVRIHRIIMNAPKGVSVDHINHNGLDNRRENLRLCNQTQNLANSQKYLSNTSGYKGVFKRSDSATYFSQIRIDGKKTYLGAFPTALEAALAYDRKAKEIHGEFANVNFQ